MKVFGRSEPVMSDTALKTSAIWTEVNQRRADMIRDQYDREKAAAARHD